MFPITDSQWVINKKFDLVFFIGSMLLGLMYFVLLIFLPEQAFLITAIVWVLFAQTHFGSTWFIYADKRNRDYFRAHPLVYYILPLLIFAAVLGLGYAKQTLLVVLISIASIYHVTRQSYGILQLYRAHNKEFDVLGKRTEAAGLFSWTLFFGTFGALRIPDFRAIFGPVLPLAEVGVYVLGAVALVTLVMMIAQFVKRPQNSLPKNLFLLNAILMYAPYLYASVILVDIYQMEIATLTSLTTHYMQYMGIVWLLNINKYQGDTQYAAENPFMHKLTKHIPSILIAIIAYALLMAFFRWGIPESKTLLLKIIPNIVLAFTAVHFFIDSFIWRFRNPFYKETALPFVRPIKVF
jgi:hypothetical protein